MSVLIDNSITIYEALEHIKDRENMLCQHSKDSMYGVWNRLKNCGTPFFWLSYRHFPVLARG